MPGEGQRALQAGSALPLSKMRLWQSPLKAHNEPTIHATPTSENSNDFSIEEEQGLGIFSC
jgi:hypothetical protein